MNSFLPTYMSPVGTLQHGVSRHCSCATVLTVYNVYKKCGEIYQVLLNVIILFKFIDVYQPRRRPKSFVQCMATTSFVRGLSKCAIRVLRSVSSTWTTLQGINGNKILIRTVERVNSYGFTPNYTEICTHIYCDHTTVDSHPNSKGRCRNLLRGFSTCSVATAKANVWLHTVSSSLFFANKISNFAPELLKMTKNGACASM